MPINEACPRCHRKRRSRRRQGTECPHRISSATKEGSYSRRSPVRDHRRADQPTGRKLLAKDEVGDFRRVERESLPRRGGRHMLDVTQDFPRRRPAILAKTIQLVQSPRTSRSRRPSIVEALEAGSPFNRASRCQLVTGEEARLEGPAAREEDARGLLLSNDETEFEDPDVLRVAKKVRAGRVPRSPGDVS